VATQPPFFNRGDPHLEQGDHAFRKWGLGIPYTRLAELDRVNESESVLWEGGGVFREAKDAFDGRAEFSAALQEVGQDLSGVSVAKAHGCRRVRHLLCRWYWWCWWEEEVEVEEEADRHCVPIGASDGGDHLDRLRDPEADHREHRESPSESRLGVWVAE
jgi:hypothetical protein